MDNDAAWHPSNLCCSNILKYYTLIAVCRYKTRINISHQNNSNALFSGSIMGLSAHCSTCVCMQNVYLHYVILDNVFTVSFMSVFKTIKIWIK